jgi:bacillithiol system protein YtxJ
MLDWQRTEVSDMEADAPGGPATHPPEGPTTFVAVESLAQLEPLFTSTKPVALFLDDPWCPVGRRAKRELADLGITLPTIDVSRHRELTAEVERRTGVRHESPQVLVLQGGEPVWDASHGRISAGRLLGVLALLSAHPQA